MLEVALTPAAADDLEAIATYSKERFGPHVADRYIGALQAEIDHLSRYPASGRPRLGLPPTILGINVARHRIYYSLEDGRLKVLRILHQAMLPSLHLED